MTPDSHPEPRAHETPEPAGTRVSRRALLSGLGAAGLGLAAMGGLAACGADAKPEVAQRKLEGSADDELPVESTPPTISGGPPVITGSFVSEKMGGKETRWAVSRPNGVTGVLPVVVVLHALNTNEKSIFGSKLEIQSVLQKYVDAGNPPFAIASADVGRNYYHLRADGTDGGAMILDEFLPMLASNSDLELSTERIGLFGWSMGGYGALRLGAMVGSPRVTSIAVSSPALWADPRNFPARAFDSQADYDANSLFGQQDRFAKIPLMISIGSSDQFFTYTRQWAAGLHPPAAFGTSAGAHTNRFWRSVLPEQVEFLGRNLAR